jgi:hypothetical protein
MSGGSPRSMKMGLVVLPASVHNMLWNRAHFLSSYIDKDDRGVPRAANRGRTEAVTVSPPQLGGPARQL